MLSSAAVRKVASRSASGLTKTRTTFSFIPPSSLLAGASFHYCYILLPSLTRYLALGLVLLLRVKNFGRINGAGERPKHQPTYEEVKRTNER